MANFFPKKIINNVNETKTNQNVHCSFNVFFSYNWDEIIFQLYHNFFSFDAPCIKKEQYCL